MTDTVSKESSGNRNGTGNNEYIQIMYIRIHTKIGRFIFQTNV